MSQTSPTYKTMEKSSTFSPELEGQSRTQMAQGSTAPVYRYIQETLHSTRHPEQSSAGDVGMRQGRPTRRSRLSVDIDRSSNGSSTLFSPSVRNRDMYINRAAVPSSELSLSDVFESVDLDNDRRIRVKEDLPVALRVLGLEWLPTYTNALLQGGTEALERVIRARKVDQASSDHTAQYSSCYQGYASLRRQVSENNAVNMQEKSGDTNVANTDTGLKQSEKPPPPPNARALSPSQSDSNVLDHLEPSKISFSTFCSIVHVLQRNNSSKKMKSVSVLSDKHRIPKNFTSRKEERSSNTHRNHHHTGAESMSSDPGLRKSNSQDRLACSGNIAHVRVEPIDSSDATGTYAGASSDSISEEAGKDSSRKCPLGEVFLGGACNPTSWRKDIAIPMLEQAGITYYNPQVENWTPDLIQIESEAKQDALILMFVVTRETRAVASMIEIAEHMSAGRNVVLVLQDVDPNIRIGGHELSADEVKDLNRGRAYLADVADRKGVKVFQNISKAVEHIIDIIPWS